MTFKNIFAITILAITFTACKQNANPANDELSYNLVLPSDLPFIPMQGGKRIDAQISGNGILLGLSKDTPTDLKFENGDVVTLTKSSVAINGIVQPIQAGQKVVLMVKDSHIIIK
jgi:hypothetical protein